jgi:hypothetical protein
MQHGAMWSDALPFFFAAMLEHRAEEYDNFTVPNKEKWDCIVNRLLPEKKRRQGDDDQRADNERADTMIERYNLCFEAQQTAGTGVENFALISMCGKNKQGGRTSGMLGGGGGAKAAPKAAATPAAGAPVKIVGEWQEIFDETYKAPYWLNVNTGATTWEKPRWYKLKLI